MSSRFNNDAQSRYSAIAGEALTVYWAKDKADYFIYFFRDNPKPLDQNIVKSDNTVSSSQKDKSTAMSDNMGSGSQKDNALD